MTSSTCSKAMRDLPSFTYRLKSLQNDRYNFPQIEYFIRKTNATHKRMPHGYRLAQQLRPFAGLSFLLASSGHRAIGVVRYCMSKFWTSSIFVRINL
jgi:hypothetical protein